MIRICHLINDLEAGGSERALVNVVRHLDPARFSNEVISLIEPGVFGKELEAAGIPLTSLRMRRGHPTLSGLVQLVRHLRRWRPTILQTWLYHADLLGTLANYFVPSTRLLWNVRCTDIATSPRPSRLLWMTRLLAHLSSRPDAVIVNSRPGKLFHETIGYRPRRWIELPNGVDTRKFRPRLDRREELRTLLGIAAQAPVIGMVARYHPMKDHETFLLAAAKLSQERPDARFVLCGIDCDGRNENLNRLIAKAGLLGRLFLLGIRDDMESIYPAFDLLTLCSTFGEGFPNVLTEAMACGIPCVATDVGDCREIIGDLGLIVARRDPDALAQAWKSMLAGPSEDRSSKVRDRAVERYRIEQICDLYGAAYAEIARMAPAGAHACSYAAMASDASIMPRPGPGSVGG